MVAGLKSQCPPRNAVYRPGSAACAVGPLHRLGLRRGPSPLDLGSVPRGERKFLSGLSDAIPDFADQVETFGDTQAIDTEFLYCLYRGRFASV
jgi:hypothetical protein